MPRPLKRGILGACIFLSKDKYAFMCCSNFYETDDMTKITFWFWCPEIAQFQNEIIGFWITVLLAKKGTYKTEHRRGNEMVCSFHRKF